MFFDNLDNRIMEIRGKLYKLRILRRLLLTPVTLLQPSVEQTSEEVERENFEISGCRK